MYAVPRVRATMPKRSATPATVRSPLVESFTVMDLRVDERGLVDGASGASSVVG